MNSKNIFNFTTWPLATFVLFGLISCTREDREKKNVTDQGGVTSTQTTSSAHEDPEGYYTCPMHPQVHQHEPGNCPICGMKLIKVDGANSATENSSPSEASSSNEVPTTARQLALAGVSRYTVERKDLTFSLPVSGRLISAREVAFQVYESDLQLIKGGLEFQGRASASPGVLLKGRIQQIDTQVDPSSRTLRVLGVLGHSLSPVVIDGGFHGVILSTAKSQLAVPVEAVLHSGMKNLVYIFAADHRLRPVPVQLGQKSADEYQILSGLHEGDVISSGPNFLIDSEAKIRGGNDQTHH